jgi:hypothetical protein
VLRLDRLVTALRHLINNLNEVANIIFLRWSVTGDLPGSLHAWHTCQQVNEYFAVSGVLENSSIDGSLTWDIIQSIVFLHLSGDFLEVSHEIFIACSASINGKYTVIFDVNERQDLMHLHRGLDELFEVRIIEQCLLLELEWLVLKLKTSNQ